MTEPAVALTDFGLFLECAVFAFLLLKSPPRPIRLWFTVFFASLGLAALLGGIVHGFFLDEASPGNRVLWPATLLCIGVTAFSEWAIAARMLWPGGVARMITRAAALLLAAYAVVILFVNQTFLAAIVHYLPPSVLLLAAFVHLYRRTFSREALMGMVGMILSFAAAGVQAGKVGLDPVYFNHNALYHLIQAAALLLIFSSARRME